MWSSSARQAETQAAGRTRLGPRSQVLVQLAHSGVVGAVRVKACLAHRLHILTVATSGSRLGNALFELSGTSNPCGLSQMAAEKQTCAHVALRAGLLPVRKVAGHVVLLAITSHGHDLQRQQEQCCMAGMKDARPGGAAWQAAGSGLLWGGCPKGMLSQ